MFTIPTETQLLNLVEQHIKMGLSPTEMVDPLTKKNVNIPTILNIMKDYISKNEHVFIPQRTITGGQPPIIPPIYNANTNPSSFQQEVQQFIRNIPFEYKLNYLNKIQETCPFLIVDPLTRTITQNTEMHNINYGYADLYRFLGLSYIPGMPGMPGMHNQQQVRLLKVPSSKQDYRPKLLPDPNSSKYYAFQERPLNSNPFYQPVNYPIPDVTGNEYLMKIKLESPAELFKKIKDLHSRVYSMYAGNSNQPMDETGIMTGKGLGKGLEIDGGSKINKNKIQTETEDLLKLFDYLFKKMTDPNLIFQSGERPMKKYFESNFHNLLTQMLIAHGIYNFEDKKPATDFEISSASADYYQKMKDYTPKMYEPYSRSFKTKPAQKQKHSYHKSRTAHSYNKSGDKKK
jgi:hypothetical protein